MIFLVEYDRERGQLVTMRSFPDEEARSAGDARLELELALRQNRISREVVLLQAANEDDLRRTHRRYFANIAELTAGSANGAMKR